MERRAIVLALALALPLALYGIPYAYASTASSDYVVENNPTSVPPGASISSLYCSNPGDYAISWGVNLQSSGVHSEGAWPAFGGQKGGATAGQTPDGWWFGWHNDAPFSQNGYEWLVCQTPIKVAGIGVPQFESLYIAIALGAVAYFLLSRRFAGRSATSAQVSL